jgi:hypothetical protein
MQQVFEVINAFVHETTQDMGIADLSALVLAYANDTDPTPPSDAEVMFHARMNEETLSLFSFHHSVRQVTDGNIRKASRPLTCQKRSGMDQRCLVAPRAHGRMQYDVHAEVFNARYRLKTIVSELRLRGFCRNPHHVKNGFVCEGCNSITTMQQAQLGLWQVAAALSDQVFALRKETLVKFRATRSKKARDAIAAQFERDLESIKAREVPKYMKERNHVGAERARLCPFVSANMATATAVTASAGDKRPADAPAATAAPPPSKKAKTVDTRPSAILFLADGTSETVDVPGGGLSTDIIQTLVGTQTGVIPTGQVVAGYHAAYVYDGAAEANGQARNDAATRSFVAAVGQSSFSFHGNVLLCDRADMQ